VLYELLAGGTPFDPQTLRAAGYDEIRRIIREVEPPKPSTKLSSLETAADSSSAESVARARRVDPRSLGRKIRGELDWVVMRCLEKDRERRYRTAEALSEDLDRYLKHEPVDAGPPSAAYRLKKFVRRNRPAVAIASVIVIAVAAMMVTSTVMWRRESALRELAESADAESRELLARLSDIVLDAEGGDGESIGGLREEAELVRRFAGDPIGEANTRVKLAFEANRRGQVGLVLHHAVRAIERFDEQGVDDTEPYLDALTLAGIASRHVGRFESAEQYAGAALTLGIELYGEKTEQTLALRNNLAVVFRHAGRWGDALGMLEEVLKGRTELLGGDDRRTLRTRRSIVGCIRNAGEYNRAIEAGRELHADSVRLLGDDDRDTLAAASNLGLALTYGGRADEPC